MSDCAVGPNAVLMHMETAACKAVTAAASQLCDNQICNVACKAHSVAIALSQIGGGLELAS